MDRNPMTGKILHLTLKIIYLLTGEDYVPIKRCDEDDITAPAPPSRERVNDEKILDLTNKIIELLTGEGEHLKEVKDEPMSNSEEDGDIHVWAPLRCKEEEIPVTISADRSCQTTSQDRAHVPPIDAAQCKEEEIATEISPGESRLNPTHRSNEGPAGATENMADLPEGGDPSETANARLNIVVIEGDLRFKEEEEEIPIAPRSGGSKNKLQRSPRPLNSMKRIQDEDEESDDTETDDDDDDDDDDDEDDEDDPISGLKIIVKSEEAETRVNMKKEAADLRGCKRTCPGRGATSSAGAQKPFPINRKLMTAEKPFYCPDCGGFFKHKSSLVLHRRIHSGEKPFTCSQCGKEFIQKANYVRHQRLHTGEKPYKCPECGKLYAQKQSLIMHQKFHAENEPFSCPECGESFIRQSHLVNHRKSHKGLKRYSCPDCGDFFMLRSSLVIHQRVHSAEKPFTGNL